jgi:hypothetical protein
MVEQMSWRKPGSVNSSVRAPPPIVSLASTTHTDSPARASSMAALKPFGPEPTMTASYAFSLICPSFVWASFV